MNDSLMAVKEKNIRDLEAKLAKQEKEFIVEKRKLQR